MLLVFWLFSDDWESKGGVLFVAFVLSCFVLEDFMKSLKMSVEEFFSPLCRWVLKLPRKWKYQVRNQLKSDFLMVLDAAQMMSTI